MNEYCRSKAAPEGSNFYYACLYQSPQSRARLYALFALYYELLEAVLSASDPGVSRIKLEWWREELARLQAGQPRHPVAEALQSFMETSAIDTTPLMTLPESMEAVFSLSPIENDSGWHQTGGIGQFWLVSAQISGPVSEEQRQLITATATALIRLEILQNLRHLLNLGFNPLPADHIHEAGLDEHALLTDTDSESVRHLIGSLVEQVRGDLDAGYRRPASRPPPYLLFVLIMNRLAAVTCREIQRDGNRVLSQRMALTPIRKLWIAWRTKCARLLL